jgi:hypothetical protein
MRALVALLAGLIFGLGLLLQCDFIRRRHSGNRNQWLLLRQLLQSTWLAVANLNGDKSNPDYYNLIIIDRFRYRQFHGKQDCTTDCAH